MIKKLKSLVSFVLDIVTSRRLILELAKKDFQIRYLGSYLGFLWAFIQPTVNILVMWFVFTVFRAADVKDYPGVLWLINGLIPWYFISECIMAGTNAITESGYLVKKVVFKVNILPVVKIVSATITHLFFILVLIIIFLIYGYPLSLMNIEVFYYIFATVFLVTGISWITSSLVIFLKDLGQIIGVVLQLGFWMTPIFWSIGMLDGKSYQFIFKLTPFYYLIEGYRDAFLYHKGFWAQPQLTLLFWAEACVIFLVGMVLFKKLRPHFADVI